MTTTLGRMLLFAALGTATTMTRAATIDGPSQALRIRQTTYVEGPLTAAGDIDYSAALNRHYGQGVVPEQNACVALWRVLGPDAMEIACSAEYYTALGIEPLANQGDYFVDYPRYLRRKNRETPPAELPGREWNSARGRPWTRHELPKVAAWINNQGEALAKVERAVRLPHFYSPAGDGTPGLEGYQCLADAMIARAMLRAGEQKFDEAIADLATCRRLARQMARGPDMSFYQAAAILENDAIDAEAILVSQIALKAEESEQRLAELRELSPFPSPTDKLELSERFVVLGILQGLARGDESSLDLYAFITLDSTSDRLSATFAGFDYEPALRHANEQFDRLIAVSQTADPAERCKRLREFSERRFAEIGDEPGDGAAIGRRLTGVYLHLAPSVYSLHVRLLQAESQLRLAYRLAADHARHGRYPASLAEAAAPAGETTDLFNGGPLVYRAEADGVLVYSVGENGVDDGGRNYRDDGETDADDIRVRLATPNAGR